MFMYCQVNPQMIPQNKPFKNPPGLQNCSVGSVPFSVTNSDTQPVGSPPSGLADLADFGQTYSNRFTSPCQIEEAATLQGCRGDHNKAT